MASKYKGIFIIGAKRTPFCCYGGSLKELPASHAFAAAAKDAIQIANLESNLIDNTVVGNAFFLSQCDGGKNARYCGLYSGVPVSKPALGVNKACGSGIQSIINGAIDIMTESAKISLTGGTEIMSALPLLVRNVRFGANLGSMYVLEDHIKKDIVDSCTGLSLQESAEKLAQEYGVKRDEVDQYAAQSRTKWKTAQDTNIFQDELTSLTVKVNKDKSINEDELHNEISNQLELGALPCIIQSGDIVTIGNSAGPADGAAALLLASEKAVQENKLLPLVKLAGWVCTGVDPKASGLGAAAAVRKLLNVTGIKADAVDLYEINERFACEVLITIKQLHLDATKVNVHGGAIAAGNPVAATGARMVTHLVHRMRQNKNIRRTIAASSCSGGQGVAVMLEQA